MQKIIKEGVDTQQSAVQILREGRQKGGQIYIEQSKDPLEGALQDPVNGEKTLFVDRHRVDSPRPQNKYKLRQIQELAGESIMSAKSGLGNATRNYKRPAVTTQQAAELYLEMQRPFNKDGLRIETIVKLTGKTPKAAIAALGNAVKDIVDDRVVLSEDELRGVKNFDAMLEAVRNARSI